MRAAIVSAVWSRLELTRIWWQAITRLQCEWAQERIPSEVFVAGSEPAHRMLCRQHGGHWIERENRPLGRKFNGAMQRAWTSGADYLLVMGQDDFLSPPLSAYLAGHMRRGTPYAGLQGIYFWEPQTGRTLFCKGYPEGHKRHGEPIGAGRLLQRSLIPEGIAWDDHRNSALDFSMTRRLNLPPAALIAVGPDTVAVDIKTGDNIWPFDAIARRYVRRDFGCEVRRDEAVLSQLPEWPDLRLLTEAVAA